MLSKSCFLSHTTYGKAAPFDHRRALATASMNCADWLLCGRRCGH